MSNIAFNRIDNKLSISLETIDKFKLCIYVQSQKSRDLAFRAVKITTSDINAIGYKICFLYSK